MTHFPPTELTFERKALGPEDPGYRPMIGNVKIVDLDLDGLPDILASDIRRNRQYRYRQFPIGLWSEFPLGDEVNSPAVATPVDLDGDGDLDVVVGVLGNGIRPTDERVGQVVWLENRIGTFVNRVLLDAIRRVSDVQAGDFDGDEDVDLVVSSFG